MEWNTTWDLVEAGLDALERREARLLVWGLVDSALTHDEVLAILDEVITSRTDLVSDPSNSIQDSDRLLEYLEAQKLLHRVRQLGTSNNLRWRTRMAEGLRLLTRLRQLTGRQEEQDLWSSGPTLVADYRFIWKPRKYPKRNIDKTTFISSTLSDVDDPILREAIKSRLEQQNSRWGASKFQVDATKRILRGLESGRPTGTLVSAGTGSGKTLAFYLPTLSWLAGRLVQSQSNKGVRVLAIYPRTELLKDQLAEVYSQSRRFDAFVGRRGGRPIRLGVLYGQVPETPHSVSRGVNRWQMVGRDFLCPYLRCPDVQCSGELVLAVANLNELDPPLTCRSCTKKIGSDTFCWNRRATFKNPPDILFTTTEMINQNLSNGRMRHVFGIGPEVERPPDVVLLDEVHLYTGTYGAQVAYLLRRWSALSGQRASFVGLSATIAQGKEFFASLTGLTTSIVEEITPHGDDLEQEGAEYLVALKGDPVSQTALLSTSIQTLMLMSRLLDPRSTMTERPFHGWRAFAFTDQLDSTNRLYYDLLDAEGRTENGRPNFSRFPNGGLARLRSRGNSFQRYEGGQDWEAIRSIGYDLAERKTIDKTTSSDSGVHADADVVIATSALEVGYDDPDVGLVVQHKAPREVSSFLQRKGRAGRKRHMRPWTIMVLSDYGRDRLAYQAHDLFFDPVLPPNALPIRNRYVRRIQAAYCLIDHLGVRMQAFPKATDTWRALSKPWSESQQTSLQESALIKATMPQIQITLGPLSNSEALPPNSARMDALRVQALKISESYNLPGPNAKWHPWNWLCARLERRFLRDALRDLLQNPDERDRLEAFLKQALHLSDGDIMPLLWEPPRSLLTEAIPTALRRISTDWRAQGIVGSDFRGNGPLPEFVPASLFNDLNVPEVELQAFVKGNITVLETLGVRQALSDFAPGKVSRRDDTIRWLGLTQAQLSDIFKVTPPVSHLKASVEQWYDLDPEPPLWITDGGLRHELTVYRPKTLKLCEPETTGSQINIRTTSNAKMVWATQIHSQRDGITLDLLNSRVGIARCFAAVHAHTHSSQTAATVRRFAVGSDATLVANRAKQRIEARTLLEFVHAGKPCGVGFSFDADAIRFELSALNGIFSTNLLTSTDTRRAARTARYIWETSHGHGLTPFRINIFQRNWLALIFQTAITTIAAKNNVPLSVATSMLLTQGVGTFESVLTKIFQSNPTADSDSDGGGDGVRNTDRLRQRLLDLLSTPTLVAALAKAAECLWSPINETWDSWLQATAKHTLAAAILEALQQLCPEIDSQDLAVDCDPGPAVDGARRPTEEIWVTETTPGGNGLIEQALTEIAKAPERFFRLLESNIRPTEHETIDLQLRRLIEEIGGETQDKTLQELIYTVRNAKSTQVSESSFAVLRQGLIKSGYVLFHGFLVTMCSRFLRPGTPPDLDAYVSSIQTRWDDLEASLGIEVDARVISALYADDATLDRIFRHAGFDVPTPVTESWRYSVISGLLWARGHALRANLLPLYTPYASDIVETEKLLLSHLLTPNEEAIEGNSADWFRLAEKKLVMTGRVAIRLPTTELAKVREIYGRLMLEPIHLEYLNFYVRSIGVRRTSNAIELLFELPEQ